MVLEEEDRLGSLLKYEADTNYCRDVVKVSEGQNLKMGTIVGIKTETGEAKIVSIADGETDGSDAPFGVLIQAVDATNGASEGVIVARDAIVNPNALVYPADATTEQKKAILKGLEKRGIVARSAA